MNKIFLSFCIATYNRVNRVEKIVKEILKSNSNEIEIIISDDYSNDDTYEVLKKIEDSRVHIFRNKKNLGPKKNWYNALDYGSGKYLFQVLDRDWINSKEIEKLINILKATDVGYAYCGESIISFYKKGSKMESYAIFNNETEGLKKFACVPSHPTGMIFKREIWKELNIKKQYFYNEAWGVYPHGFICTYFAMRSKGAIIDNKICGNVSALDQKRVKSRYYEKQCKDDYWWTTKSHFRDLIRATKVISKINISSDLKKEIILERYKDHIYTGTLEYKHISSNVNNANHYSINVEKVSNFRIIKNAIIFYISFLRFLNQDKIECNIKKDIFIITFKSICRIYYSEIIRRV